MLHAIEEQTKREYEMFEFYPKSWKWRVTSCNMDALALKNIPSGETPNVTYSQHSCLRDCPSDCLMLSLPDEELL